jgi:hypothetical protein
MRRMMLGLGLALGLAVMAKPALAAEGCAPEGRMHYVCGPVNVEDMVLTPGTSWIIGSSDRPKDGRLYLIDAKAKTFKDLMVDLAGPAQAPFKDCPRPLKAGEMIPHGLNLRPGAGRKHTLYVVNHGGRESIEVFEIDASGAEPKGTWIGCEVLPEGASGNSVAPLPGGGFVVTRFMTANDPQAFQKMAAGEKNGVVYAWRPGAGFTTVPGSQMSGPNGIEVWRGQVVVNGWPGQLIHRLAPSGEDKSVATGNFSPDNLRWGPDGRLLAAGQAMDVKTAISCNKPKCPHGWVVARLDPATMTLTPVLHVEGTDAFSDATTGLQVGDEMWIGTYSGDRVAWTKLEPAH